MGVQRSSLSPPHTALGCGAQPQSAIRDNGSGIDNEILRAGGRPGHWGLKGMRERANRLRASLAIRKRLERGTEVELRIPASLAFTARARPEASHSKE